MSLSILLDSFSSWSNNSARYSRCRNIRSSYHNNVLFFFFIGFTQKEYRVTVKTYRNGLREAKAHLKLNLVRDVKSKRKGFTGISAAKGRPGQIWAHWWVGQESWWQNLWRRPRSVVSSTQSLMVRFAFRNLGPIETNGKSGARITYPW